MVERKRESEKVGRSPEYIQDSPKQCPAGYLPPQRQKPRPACSVERSLGAGPSSPAEGMPGLNTSGGFMARFGNRPKMARTGNCTQGWLAWKSLAKPHSVISSTFRSSVRRDALLQRQSATPPSLEAARPDFHGCEGGKQLFSSVQITGTLPEFAR